MFLETFHTGMIISKAQEERYHSEGWPTSKCFNNATCMHIQEYKNKSK